MHVKTLKYAFYAGILIIFLIPKVALYLIGLSVGVVLVPFLLSLIGGADFYIKLKKYNTSRKEFSDKENVFECTEYAVINKFQSSDL